MPPDAAFRNALELKEALKKAGQWETFRRHVVEMGPDIYTRLKPKRAID